jgi:hypothetical protein
MGTDDLIVPAASEVYIFLAQEVLERDGLDTLRTPMQMELFLQSCLAHMSNHHSVDTSWVLCSLASRRGISKLRHIMLQPVSIDASNDTVSSSVSFQKVTLPLIGLLTRQSICQTVLRTESNVIYALVNEYSHQFLGSTVLPSIRSLLDRGPASGSVSESPNPYQYQQHHQHLDSLENTLPLPCAILAIVRLFYQVLTRFPDSVAELAYMVVDLIARTCTKS